MKRFEGLDGALYVLRYRTYLDDTFHLSTWTKAVNYLVYNKKHFRIKSLNLIKLEHQFPRFE